MRKRGFTLVEVTLSMGLLSVVALLAFVVLRGSTETAALAQAKAEVQAGVRDAMNAITAELRTAYTQRTVDTIPPIAPRNTVSIVVSEAGDEITFQIPVRLETPEMVQSSLPITIRYENEDTGGSGMSGNAILDPGEDSNEDGMLTRRLLRTQDGISTVVGATNTLSGVRFQLLPNQSVRNNQLTTLYIWLEASKRYGPGQGKMVRAQLETTIALEN